MLARRPNMDAQGDGSGHIMDSYTYFPGYYWKWPKYATNPLDRQPNAAGLDRIDGEMDKFDLRVRLSRPRKIVIRREDGTWEPTDAPKDLNVPYISISFAGAQFKNADGEKDLLKIQRMAEAVTLQVMKDEKHQAYCLDCQCLTEEYSRKINQDVYPMCDVVRGSKKIAILLNATDK